LFFLVSIEFLRNILKYSSRNIESTQYRMVNLALSMFNNLPGIFVVPIIRFLFGNLQFTFFCTIKYPTEQLPMLNFKRLLFAFL